MSVAGEGAAPDSALILKVAEAAGIERKEVNRIVEQVNAAVGGWAKFADEAGCSGKRSRGIGGAFVGI